MYELINILDKYTKQQNNCLIHSWHWASEQWTIKTFPALTWLVLDCSSIKNLSNVKTSSLTSAWPPTCAESSMEHLMGASLAFCRMSFHNTIESIWNLQCSSSKFAVFYFYYFFFFFFGKYSRVVPVALYIYRYFNIHFQRVNQKRVF